MASSVSFGVCADLVEHVGGPKFGRALMRAAREVVDADYCSLFAFPSDTEPVCLASCGVESDRSAVEASRRYLATHWRNDPVMSGRAAQPTHLLHQSFNVVADATYRYECFDQLNIGDRLILLFDDREVRLRLSFYRFRNRHAFAGEDGSRALRAADLFHRASSRHLRLSRAAALNALNGLPSVPLLAQRVRNLNVAFSRREVEVCARILAGVTAEGIALDLGIGTHSVVTYRKRAYAKLGITTQNELFARCLAHG